MMVEIKVNSMIIIKEPGKNPKIFVFTIFPQNAFSEDLCSGTFATPSVNTVIYYQFPNFHQFLEVKLKG